MAGTAGLEQGIWTGFLQGPGSLGSSWSNEVMTLSSGELRDHLIGLEETETHGGNVFLKFPWFGQDTQGWAGLQSGLYSLCSSPA